MSRVFGSLALACLLGACSDRTQLIVVVDSDLRVPGELDGVRLAVEGPSGMSAEAAQTLGGAGDPELPLTLSLRPAGAALGPIEITAEGLLDGSAVVTRVAITSLVSGEARVLRLFLARDCRAVQCAGAQTCTESGCASAEIDPESLPPWTGEVRRDAGTPDGGRRDGGGGDAGPPLACSTGSDCDDGIDCTVGVCTDGVCSQRPDDSLCTASADGVCDPVHGCQYAECTAATCVAGPCQSATCVGDRCERESLCAAGEMCCAGMCVPAGCDDGNPCTDDACGAAGCENVNNTAPCNDGVFCNGADTCSDGSCSAHAGSPCSGSAVCDESMDVCTGCLVAEDCGPPLPGAWGDCGGFSGMCGRSGMKSRSVTTFACVSGTCVGSTSTETAGCTRETDGNGCGTTSCTGFGSCGGFADDCDLTGTASRTCTDYVCAGGSCTTTTRTESQDCTRETDGRGCRAASCGGWSTCGGFTSPCDQTGKKSRSCTEYTCSAGSCVGGLSRIEEMDCSRTTNGDPCDDGLLCTQGETCFGGSCQMGVDQCSGGCICTSSGCQNPSSPYQFCAIQ